MFVKSVGPSFDLKYHFFIHSFFNIFAWQSVIKSREAIYVHDAKSIKVFSNIQIKLVLFLFWVRTFDKLRLNLVVINLLFFRQITFRLNFMRGVLFSSTWSFSEKSFSAVNFVLKSLLNHSVVFLKYNLMSSEFVKFNQNLGIFLFLEQYWLLRLSFILSYLFLRLR